MALLPISTSSYNSFRSDVLTRASQGLGYDVDGYYGYQCWDLCAELWMNLPEFANSGLWPHTGTNLWASECWTQSRTENAGDSFDLIYTVEDLKRGDVIVLDSSAISATGHIAFCDEDYTGDTMNLLGQNQVNPSLTLGHIPTVTNINITAFLGGFRLKTWSPTPPTPPHPIAGRGRTNFPWVLYARKLRKNM